MGGSINVAIRYEDGRVWSGEVWTNPLPHFTTTLTSADDPQAVADEYTARYTHTDAACGPDGYGLVVYDCRSKTILHMQGYSQLNTVLGITRFPNQKLLDSDYAFYADLHQRGLLYMDTLQYRSDGDSPHAVLIEGSERRHRSTEWDSVEAFMRKAGELQTAQLAISLDSQPSIRTRVDVYVDPAPWTIQSFEEGEGARAFREALDRLGFTLSLAEELLWERYIAEHEADQEDEDEDDDENPSEAVV